MKKKRLTIKDKSFVQGYIYAYSTMIKAHGNDSEVEDCLRGDFLSVEDLRRHEVEEYDIEILMPVIKEIERKRAL